jgi:hypothetical protein
VNSIPLRLTGGLALALVLLATTEARGVPAFARQTGASCSSCHFQHFPALTRYGRTFKSGGFTLTGGQSLIEGELLSLTSVLNASVVTKVRYVKTNGGTGAGTDMGELQFPDEAAIWLGGRVGTHAGFVLEAQLTDPSAPIFASFKMPLGLDVAGGRLSAIPFSTDGLGTPFGFELFNTGAVRNVRVLEDRSAISAQQYVVAGGDEGVAEGVAVAFSTPAWFASVTPWSPDHGPVALNRPAWYFRAGVTPTLGAWDLGAGAQLWAGSAQARDQVTRAWAIDGQAQGRVGTLPLGIYLAYARAGASPDSGRENLFNTGPTDQEAFSALAELGVLPGKVTAGIGYRLGDNGRAGPSTRDGAMLLGGTWLLAQNVELQFNHILYHGSAWSGGRQDQRTIVMLFAAF